jgi:hypothetical protein
MNRRLLLKQVRCPLGRNLWRRLLQAPLAVKCLGADKKLAWMFGAKQGQMALELGHPVRNLQASERIRYSAGYVSLRLEVFSRLAVGLPDVTVRSLQVALRLGLGLGGWLLRRRFGLKFGNGLREVEPLRRRLDRRVRRRHFVPAPQELHQLRILFPGQIGANAHMGRHVLEVREGPLG